MVYYKYTQKGGVEKKKHKKLNKYEMRTKLRSK